MAQFSTPPIERRPMTTKQARKKWQKRGCPTVSSAERRKINRDAELERRAQEIRDKEQRKKDNKKKREEKEAREREKRLRMGIQQEVKLPEGQLGLGQFFTAKTMKFGAGESHKLAVQKETIQDQDFDDGGADGEGVLFWNNTKNDAVYNKDDEHAHDADSKIRGSQKHGSNDQLAEAKSLVIVASGIVHIDHDKSRSRPSAIAPQNSKTDCDVMLLPFSSQRRLSRSGSPFRRPVSEFNNNVLSHGALPQSSQARKPAQEHKYHDKADHGTGLTPVNSRTQEPYDKSDSGSASGINKSHQELKSISNRPSFFANYAQYMEEKLIRSGATAEVVKAAKSAPVSRQVSPDIVIHRRANSVPHTAIKRNWAQAQFDVQEETQNDRKDIIGQSNNARARKRPCSVYSDRTRAQVGIFVKPERHESFLNSAEPVLGEASATKGNDSRLLSPKTQQKIPSAIDSFSVGFSDNDFEEFSTKLHLVRRPEGQSADPVAQDSKLVPSGDTSLGDSFDGGLGDDDLLDIDDRYETPSEVKQASMPTKLEPQRPLHDDLEQMPHQLNPTEINSAVESSKPSGSQSSQSFGFDFGSDDLRVLDQTIMTSNQPFRAEIPIKVSVVHRSSDEFDCSQDLSVLVEEFIPDCNELLKPPPPINKFNDSHSALNSPTMPPPPIPIKKHQASLFKKPSSCRNRIIVPAGSQDEFDSFFAGSTQALLAIDI